MSKLLPRPAVRNISEVPEILNQFCYIMDYCTDDGFSMLIDNNDATIKFGDFSGNTIDIINDNKYIKHISLIMEKYAYKYIELMTTTRVKMIQLFFVENATGELRLVEAMTHLNKYQSPGMLRDVFAKVGIPALSTKSIEILNQDSMAKLADGKYIIYPSSPKFITRNNESEPLRAKTY